MADRDNKKYYWLKLQKDFFKRHDIKIVESMKNGKDYIIFYLKLLCESTSHNGELRFSETIPYNEEMLSTITDTNVDIVRQAIKLLTELGMLEILDDGTLYMTEMYKMIGSETGDAKRKREYRERLRNNEKQLEMKSGTNVGQCPLEIEKDKELEKELEKDKKKAFKRPTLEEVSEYCKERNNTIDPQSFLDYYDSVGWVIGNNKHVKDWKACVRTWEQRRNEKSKERGNVPNYEQERNSFEEFVNAHRNEEL